MTAWRSFCSTQTCQNHARTTRVINLPIGARRSCSERGKSYVTGAFLLLVSRVLSYLPYPPIPLSLSLSLSLCLSVSLSLSLGTCRRELWERGFCSPRLAHGAKMPRSPRLAHNAPVMQANSTRSTNFDYKIISLRSWPYGRSFRI